MKNDLNIYRITKPTSIAYDLWRFLSMVMWFGVAFAACTVIIAGVLALIIGAIVMGLVMPSRTVRGQLARLVLNMGAAVDLIRSLR